MSTYDHHHPPPTPRPTRPGERGASVASLLVALSLLVVGLTTALLVATVSSVSAGVTRERTERRIAAEAILASSAVARSAPGGSIAPAAPVEGYADTVRFDERSGQIVPADPGGGAGIARQWRVRASDDGGRLLEVSARHANARGTAAATTYFASRRLR